MAVPLLRESAGKSFKYPPLELHSRFLRKVGLISVGYCFFSGQALYVSGCRSAYFSNVTEDCMCALTHLFVQGAPSKEKNDVDAIAATAQGYYDSDNAFNFYRQARKAATYIVRRRTRKIVDTPPRTDVQADSLNTGRVQTQSDVSLWQGNTPLCDGFPS